jgi:hypothetical protein
MFEKSNPSGLGPGFTSDEEEPVESEESLWHKSTLALVEPNAAKWFEDLDPVFVQDKFKRQIESQVPSRSRSVFFTGQLEASIVPEMEIDLADLGEVQDLESTEIGRAVLAELRSLGVTFHFVDKFPINHYQAVQLDVKNKIEGQWGTALGTPFVQHFSVYKDKSEMETGVWSVNLLASPVPLTVANEFEFDDGEDSGVLFVPDEQLADGMLCFGEISSKIHLPVLLKKLAFMSETPFPSTQLISFSRDLAFEQTPKSARPIPTFSILQDSGAMSASVYGDRAGSGGSNEYKGQILPELVVFGWRFGKESISFLSEILPIVVDGCTYAVSTIEDGYNYYRNEEYPSDYDSVLANPCTFTLAYERGNSRLGRAQWIPVTELGRMIATSEKSIQLADELEDSGDLESALKIYHSVYLDGVGSFIASAINSLTYLDSIPRLVDDPSGLGEVEFMLDQAISLNVLNQSTNALTNLGLARMLVGEDELALEALEKAIARTDNDGNAEAKQYLSLLYGKLGNAELEEKYAADSIAAGGFQVKEYVLQALGLGPDQGSLSQKARASFCGKCGNAFQDEGTNFCTSCGTSRG